MLKNDKDESLLELSGLKDKWCFSKGTPITTVAGFSCVPAIITPFSSCKFFFNIFQNEGKGKSGLIGSLIDDFESKNTPVEQVQNKVTLKNGPGVGYRIQLGLRNLNRIGYGAEETLGSGEDTLGRGEETLEKGEEILESSEETLGRGEDSLESGEESLESGEDGLGSAEETLSKGEETLGKGEETLGSGEETLGKGEETLGSGEETLSKGEETLGKGEETLSKGEETLGKGEETLSKGKETLGRIEDIFLKKNIKSKSKIYTKDRRRQIW